VEVKDNARQRSLSGLNLTSEIAICVNGTDRKQKKNDSDECSPHRESNYDFVV
jgi:hypothetical protein